MQWFKNLKISVKLISGFLLVAIIGAIIGLLGIQAANTMENAGEKMYTNLAIPISQLGDISTLFQRERINVRDFVFAKDNEEREARKKDIHDIAKKITDVAEEYKKTILTEQGQKDFQEFSEAHKAYQNILEKVFALTSAGKYNLAEDLVDGDGKNAAFHEQEVIDKMVSQKVQIAENTHKGNVTTGNSTRLTLIIIISVGFLFSLFLGIYISRLISSAVNVAKEAVKTISQGDLTIKLKTDSRDEIGQMVQSLIDMLQSLSDIVGKILGHTENVSSAAEELNATAQTMSQGANEQAASVEETSASLEEISSSISQNSDNAKTTNGLASKNAAEATEGGKAVTETLGAMKEIADKIGMVEDIAYNTNLLALNAAIEAARAGEHGKGFAVVASEVRKLAERSQVAAQEISQLAVSSVNIAERAGQLLTTMVPNIRKTADLIEEITAASGQQASGVSQINQSMSMLDKVTTQNASGAEELAATAEELSGSVESLKELVSFFKIEGGAKQVRSETKGHVTSTREKIAMVNKGLHDRHKTDASGENQEPLKSPATKADEGATHPAGKSKITDFEKF